jgi:hypothetical protein
MICFETALINKLFALCYSLHVSKAVENEFDCDTKIYETIKYVSFLFRGLCRINTGMLDLVFRGPFGYV